MASRDQATRSPVPARPVSQRDVRDQNLRLALRAVADGGATTRARVAAEIGLTKATVSALVEQLGSAGLVVDHGPAATGRLGRPGSVIALDADGGPVGLGLEINVDYLAACVVDLAGDVRALEVRPVDNVGRGPRPVLASAIRLARRTLDAVDRPRGLAGVTVAVPGPVEQATGTLVSAPNLGWARTAVAEHVAAGLGVPRGAVALDNEANLAAQAEAWAGCARGIEDFVEVVGEIGVGGALVLDGTLFRGVHGFAGEIGHVAVVTGGEQCGCGAHGCLETVAGQRALLAGAGIDATVGTRMGGTSAAAAMVVERARAGDAATL
ncbi:MAG: ROK family protein, partial [Actinomycetota bacterium]|nr:ROK family protein [Actinomycetota bacterium]